MHTYMSVEAYTYMNYNVAIAKSLYLIPFSIISVKLHKQSVYYIEKLSTRGNHMVAGGLRSNRFFILIVSIRPNVGIILFSLFINQLLFLYSCRMVFRRLRKNTVFRGPAYNNIFVFSLVDLYHRLILYVFVIIWEDYP